MSRYIPPALRNIPTGSVPLSSSVRKPPPKVPHVPSYSLAEIRDYYFPTVIDAELPSLTSTNSRTLHDSATTPGKLSHILLFKDANPRWDTDGIVYTKSALELLPPELAEGSPSADLTPPIDNQSQHDDHHNDPVSVSTGSTATASLSTPTLRPQAESSITSHNTIFAVQTQPIAVYAQTLSSSRSHALFTFEGYYEISNLQFLQPRSPELIRMLEQKWTIQHHKSRKTFQKSRSKEQWDESLKSRWAVVKFTKDKEALKELGAPKIEKLEPVEEPLENKSVNEMLREMRLGREAGNDHSGQQQTDPIGDRAQRTFQAPTRQPRGPTEGTASPSPWGKRATHAVDRFVEEHCTKTVGVDESSAKNNWQAFAETASLPKVGSGGDVHQRVRHGDTGSLST